MMLAPAPINPSRLFALVPCAGVGERAGAAGPKQYALLTGRSLVAHTLNALQAVTRLSGTLVVLSPQDKTFEASAPGFNGWVSREGGATRAQTVANGLQALVALGASPDDWVLVHDAARCLVRAEWIDTLIDACLPGGDGGLLALPVADTLKSEQGGFVEATVDRRSMWQAQTPQMFRIGPLQQALAKAGTNVTDEASAMEAAGHMPRLVPGSLENFKVTYPADFDLAERLLRTRT